MTSEPASGARRRRRREVARRGIEVGEGLVEHASDALDEVVDDVRRIVGRPAKEPRPGRSPDDTPVRAGDDRALRGLVGGGRSQVGVERAMRARDVSRPTPENLAEAERSVVIRRSSRQ